MSLLFSDCDDEPLWCMFSMFMSLWRLPALNADLTPHESNSWEPERRMERHRNLLLQHQEPCRSCPGCTENGDGN